MTKYRNNLPQLTNGIFLTDSGLETTLIFYENFELPEFAAFPLLKDERGFEMMRDYYRRHAALARKAEVGFILESVTWRANADWGKRLGYSENELAEANRQAIEMLLKIPARVWRDVMTGMLAADSKSQLGKIKAPTLILWGDKETIFLRAEQDSLVSAIPNAVFKVYAEAGHSPHWERPEQFVKDFEEFCATSQNRLW